MISLLLALSFLVVWSGSAHAQAVVSGRALTQETVNSTSVAMTNPASVAAGDRLFAVYSCRNAGAFTVSTGWTELEDTAASSSTSRLGVATRIATGTADDTLTVGKSTTCSLAGVMFRITNAHQTSLPEGGTVNSDGTGTSTAADNVGVTASWTGESNLFIDTAAVSFNIPCTGFPATYANGQTPLATGGTPSAACTAEKTATSDSDNPAAFILNSGATWISRNWVIRAAPAGGATPARIIGSGCCNRAIGQ